MKSNRVRLRQPAALAILLALGAGCREAGDPCTSTADCLDTERYREVCIDGVCREVCNSSQTCLPGEVCSRGACMPASAEDDAAVADAAAGRDRVFGDHSAQDAGGRDAALPDAAPADAALPDATPADTALPDAAPADAALPDATPADTAQPDTALPDTVRSDSATLDLGSEDAGLPSYFDLTWDPPAALGETIDLSRCETDPVLTPDERWLILSRPENGGADCYDQRRFHIFAWNGGTPVYHSLLPKFDSGADENNPHPVAGEVAGRPGELLLIHTVNAAALELRGVWLQGDPPTAAAGAPFPLTSINSLGAASSPTLTFDADRIAFVRDSDVYEAAGSPPDAYGAAVQLTTVASAENDTDPALSPDGRVLVFVRGVTRTDSYDLWVARRSDPSSAFGAPERLPYGEGQINTDKDDMDAFITPSGDLLFTSARDDGTALRVYIAPRATP